MFFKNILTNPFISSQTTFSRLLTACILCASSFGAYAQSPADTVSNSTKNIIGYVQRVMNFNRNAPQEKVYMHFDNTGYFEGETIWFKAYVTRSDNGRPTDLSKVLYVELVNPSGDILQSKKYYIDENGQSHGEIKVDSIFGTGFYEVRAYTRYMTNWGVNAIFSRVFPVFKAPKEEGDYSDLTIDTKLFKGRDPNNRDSSDSLYAKSIEEGIYANEDVKTISAQFYPEGGDLIQGKKCRVAMLAVSDNGKPYEGEGTVTNAQGSVLASVKTDAQGKGSFFVVPDGSELTFKMRNVKGKVQSFTLPEAKKEGCALTLDAISETMLATIQCSDVVCGDLIGYALMNNGNIYYVDTVVASPILEVELDRSIMKEGVNQFTVFNSRGRVMADRLFFICPDPSATDSISFTAESQWLKPCGRVALDVQTLPNATFSFSAMDAATLTGARQGNMKTWMLLSSEVRGYIDHVESYFESDDEAHRRAADMLMLTQGWRRYSWNEMAGLAPRKMEPVEDKFYVFGKLNEVRKRNPVGGVDLQVILYNQQGQNLRGQTKTDANGNYAFELPFMDGEWKMFFYTMIDDKKKSFHVGVDRQISPVPRFISPVETSVKMPSAPNLFVHKEGEEPPEEFIPITKQNIVLKNVTVRAKRRYFTNDDFVYKNENYGRKWASFYYNIDRELDNIRDLGGDEPTIFEFLAKKNAMFGNPEAVGLPEPQSGDSTETYTEWTGRMAYGGNPIEWIVDNGETDNAGARTSVAKSEGDIFFPMTLDEIKSVYISAYDPDAYARGLGRTQSGENPISEIDAARGFDNSVKIYIYRHHKFTTSSNKGLRRTYFQGFDKVDTFKTEDYSVIPPMADFRRTLFWAPDVKADADGKAHIEFFNNSTCEEMYISAEGMNPEGRVVVKD